MYLLNKRYGRGKNKALDLSQVGKKHELLEKQVIILRTLNYCRFIVFLDNHDGIKSTTKGN